MMDPGTPKGFFRDPRKLFRSFLDPYKRDPNIFRDSKMDVGLGNSRGPFRGPMSLGIPENPSDQRYQNQCRYKH